MRSARWSFLLTLITAFVLGGCTITRVIKLKPLHQEVDKNLGQVQTHLSSMGENNKKLARTISYLRPPLIPNFNASLEEALAITDKMQQQFILTKNYAHSHPLRLKSKVTSQEKEYAQVKVYQSHLNDEFKKIEALSANYNLAVKNINQLFSEHSVLILPSRKTMEAQGAVLASFSNQLDSGKKTLQKVRGQTKSSQQDKLKKLDEMDQVLAELEQEYGLFKSNYEQALQLFPGEEMVIDPGSPLYSQVVDLQAIQKRIQSRAERFNHLAQNL
jgi:hypothetical protein